MVRVMTSSRRGLGGWVIMPASGGSSPSANAGAPSVTKLIQRICVARSGESTRLPLDGTNPITSASNAKEHRHDFAKIRRQQVAQELSDVGQNRPSFLDGGDDGGKIIIGQHDAGQPMCWVVYPSHYF